MNAWLDVLGSLIQNVLKIIYTWDNMATGNSYLINLYIILIFSVVSCILVKSVHGCYSAGSRQPAKELLCHATFGNWKKCWGALSPSLWSTSKSTVTRQRMIDTYSDSMPVAENGVMCCCKIKHILFEKTHRVTDDSETEAS